MLESASAAGGELASQERLDSVESVCGRDAECILTASETWDNVSTGLRRKEGEVHKSTPPNRVLWPINRNVIKSSVGVQQGRKRMSFWPYVARTQPVEQLPNRISYPRSKWKREHYLLGHDAACSVGYAATLPVPSDCRARDNALITEWCSGNGFEGIGSRNIPAWVDVLKEPSKNFNADSKWTGRNSNQEHPEY
jgi:hypothetical protein